MQKLPHSSPLSSSQEQHTMEPSSKGYTLDATVDLRGRTILASDTGKWRACAFLVVYEAFERMAFYGIASNLVVYLTTQLHEDTLSSVRNVNNWSGSVWLTPIIGAYIADAYLGRFWTFTISSIIYVLGMLLLTMAVTLKSLRPTTCIVATGGAAITPCSNKASPLQISIFYIALYTIAVGAGGTKPNISTFGADQFDDFDPREKELKVSFFNWWMFSAFIGALFATLGLVYIQENLGWGLGYAIPTIGLTLSLVVFYLGTPFYRHKPRNPKSPANDVVQVIVATLCNFGARAPDDPSQLHEVDPHCYLDNGLGRVHYTPTFRFLDKAAIKETSGKRQPCTVTQVEKTKLILGMFIIWLTLLVPSTIWAQVNTLFVKQGTTLDRRLPGGSTFMVPAASLGSFITISMLVTVPLYDRYFVRYMRRRTGNPRGITLLQRIGIGCLIQILAVAVAYFVELRRMQVIKAEKVLGAKAIVPMSILWLLPQYVLLGVADVFNAIGLLEFFYDQSPEDMQSLGTTFFTTSIGVGNFLNSLLLTALDRVTASPAGGGKSWIGNNLNDSHLDYFYGFLVGLAGLNMGLFLWASWAYVYKKERGKAHVDDVGVMLEEKT